MLMNIVMKADIFSHAYKMGVISEAIRATTPFPISWMVYIFVFNVLKVVWES